MTITYTSVLRGLWAVLLASAVANGAAAEVNIGSVKQLFIDNHVIDQMDGVEKVFHQPMRYGSNPILAPEYEWEHAQTETPSVFWDLDIGKFRMYYWACVNTTNTIYTCYAESDDGLAWTKPVLNLHNGPDGTTNNNIVLRGPGNTGRARYVAINPYSTNPATKYIGLYVDDTPGLSNYVAYSPDGLHWTTTQNFGDLRNVTGYSPTDTPAFFLVEQKWAEGQDRGYRAIWRTETSDMETWGGGVWAITRAPTDSPDLEFYQAKSSFIGDNTYAGMHVGYVDLFHTDPNGQILPNGVRMSGTIDAYLMYSRDSINWTMANPDEPFLPLGESGAWDAGMVLTEPAVIVGDQMRFYYSGWDREHGSFTLGAIGLATLRLDGFVSLEPTEGQGTIVTKLLEFAGQHLEINALIRPGGSLRVGLLDEEGTPIPGFEESDPLVGDGVAQVVTFDSQWNLSQFEGTPVALAFYLDDAALYSFTFSSTIIPEPPALILLGLAVAFLWACRCYGGRL